MLNLNESTKWYELPEKYTDPQGHQWYVFQWKPPFYGGVTESGNVVVPIQSMVKAEFVNHFASVICQNGQTIYEYKGLLYIDYELLLASLKTDDEDMEHVLHIVGIIKDLHSNATQENENEE